MIIAHRQHQPAPRDVYVRAMNSANGPEFRIKLELGDVTVYLLAEEALGVSKMLSDAVQDAANSDDISPNNYQLDLALIPLA